jgi:hypothetical protein
VLGGKTATARRISAISGPRFSNAAAASSAGITEDEIDKVILAGKLIVLFDDEGNIVTGSGILRDDATAAPPKTYAGSPSF